MVEVGEYGGTAGAAARAGQRWRTIAAAPGYDMIVRLAVAFWFMAFATVSVREIATAAGALLRLGGDAPAWTSLLAKLCIFVFFAMLAALTLLRSRPIGRAPGLQPRLAALLGCYMLYALPLVPGGASPGVAVNLVSAGLILFGTATALAALKRLGRSFSIMAEARQLVTDGPYAVVRHPLYLAEQVSALGACLGYFSPWAAVLFVAQLACQIQRMRNEEAVLRRHFSDYDAYARRTYRLIPGLW